MLDILDTAGQGKVRQGVNVMRFNCTFLAQYTVETLNLC